MALKLAVLGGCGLAFLGYCIYFDRKRRTAPDFKKKLRESKWGLIDGQHMGHLLFFSVFFRYTILCLERKQIKEENAKSEAKAKVIAFFAGCQISLQSH